jgi:hypothetical protein
MTLTQALSLKKAVPEIASGAEAPVTRLTVISASGETLALPEAEEYCEFTTTGTQMAAFAVVFGNGPVVRLVPVEFVRES